MTHHWDEFSKSLAVKSVPRRESLRLLGTALAGALFSPLGLGTAWARGPDPCKAFCHCRNRQQQDACLAACHTCYGDTSRLAGSCGGYVCCSTASCSGVCSDLKSDPNCGVCGNNCRDFGETCCGNYCADLANDFANCGRCGAQCDDPGPYEFGACVEGACVYDCVDGAADCGGGTCTYLGSDPNNCGACGNVCPDTAPVCIDGVCSPNPCGGGGVYCPHVAPTFGPGCTFLEDDNYNCGACGHYCDICNQGVCDPGSPPPDYP